jgi:23S rRNA pseudouridine2457 synthase
MPRYLLVNKPFNVLSTFTDPAGRPTLKDLVPVTGVYAAGRLDYDSEGLLLLTDDGGLIHQLTDPRYEHPKIYYVQLEGLITEDAVTQLRRGVALRGERTRPAAAEIVPDPGLPPRPVPLRAYHPTSWLRVVLREGKKRQLRRMTAAVGFPTLRLVRVALGPLTLGDLQPGQWRELAPGEVQALRGGPGPRRRAG